MTAVRGDIACIDVRPYIYGGTAAVVAEICTFPLDTVKTILQVQGCKSHTTQYQGTVECLHSVVRKEGVARLYKGLSPAVLRQAVYGTIKYGLYYSIKDWAMIRYGVEEESLAINILCGILAGKFSFNKTFRTVSQPILHQSICSCLYVVRKFPFQPNPKTSLLHASK